MGCCVRTARGLLQYDDEASFGDGIGAAKRVAARLPDFGTVGREYQRSEDVTATDIPIRGFPVSRSGSIKTTVDMRGLLLGTVPVATYAGAAVVGHGCSDFLYGAMGGYVAGGYGEVIQPGTTTTEITMTAPQAATFAGGSLLQVAGATTGMMMVGRVKSVAAAVVTLHWALPEIPETGAPVIGGRLFYKTDPSVSYGVEWCGENLDDTRSAVGCVVDSMSIKCPPLEKATMEVGFFASKFDLMTDNNEASHTALTEWTDPYPYPMQGYDGGLWAIPYTVSGNVYGTPIRIQGGFELDLGMEMSPVQGVHGDQPNGVAGVCVSRRSAVLRATAECFRNYTSGGVPSAGEGAYWMDAFNDQTEYAVIGWVGQGYNQFAANIPRAVLRAHPMPQDSNGRATLVLEFEECNFTGDDAGGNQANSSLTCLFTVGAIV